MPISQKIGGLPVLSWVYDYGWFWAALFIVLADFAPIYFWMWAEYKVGGALPPWERDHYKTFLWNDTIWIPLIMAMAVIILKDAPKLDGWYTHWLWHVFLLVAGFAISIYLEYDALTGVKKQYTWAQEVGPAKMYHTFIFGIVFYWLLSALVPVIVVHQPAWAVLLLMVGVGFFFRNSYLDATLPIPHTAHPEWDWRTLTATTRWR